MFDIARTGQIESFVTARPVFAEFRQMSRQGLHLLIVQFQRSGDDDEPLADLNRVSAAGTRALEIDRPRSSLVWEERWFNRLERFFRILRPNVLRVRYWSHRV